MVPIKIKKGKNIVWLFVFAINLQRVMPDMGKEERKKVKLLGHVQLCDPVDCSLPGSSIHGILQTRILEWVAISFSRGSSWHRDPTQVSDIAGRHFNLWATRDMSKVYSKSPFWMLLYKSHGTPAITPHLKLMADTANHHDTLPSGGSLGILFKTKLPKAQPINWRCHKKWNLPHSSLKNEKMRSW